ncbi:carboxymuconolactone decarboxylase family protein [Phaeacidiphilus oryzae]|uniref:carboxymuconolactone decarboxylase family protein n=1 Tax=Phaeacidiphilus oryzae TaxID=348818 RepID=UPI000A5F33F0|nr:carboxymuconolactone decarboxylase family protein [Phaeacidiphilus oryzae]
MSDTLQPRVKNPVSHFPEATGHIQAIMKSLYASGVPQETMELVHLRASQINGCSVCVDGGARSARRAGMSEERLHAVAAWREAPYYTEAERSAIALAEAATRLADQPDGVRDEVWDAAAKHFDERQISGIVLMIAMTNMFNRVNATTRQLAGPQPWEQSS